MYIVIASSIATAKNGSPYCKLSVRSLEEAFDINIWNCKKAYNVGDSVDIRNIQDKDGFKSTSADNVFVHTTPVNSPLWQFIPKPPTKGDWDSLCNAIGEIINLPDVWNDLSHKLYGPYSVSTAARTNHHNFKGGLAQHTFEMLKMAYHLIVSGAIPFEVNRFVVFTSLLFHDFGKMSEYNQEDFSYRSEMFLMGHPYISAKSFVKLSEQYQIPERMVQAIEHCILAHHMFKEWGSPVIPCNQEAMLVACIDMISGKGVQLANAQNEASVEGTKVVHC